MHDAYTVTVITLAIVAGIAGASVAVFGMILMLRERGFRTPLRARALAIAVLVYLTVCAFSYANRPLPAMGSTSKRSVYSESRPRDPVRGALIDASRAYGINLRRFVAVAKCESSLDPNARSDSGAYLGVMQQHRGYWPARAARAGFRGASPFDPRANVFTAAHMIRHGGGWGHWQTCSRGGRA